MMDLRRIEELIEVIRGARVTELAVRDNGSAVVVRKPVGSNGCRQPVPQVERVPDPPPVVEEPQHEEKTEAVITALMVGIFHVLDGVKSRGVEVKKGQVIGAIESMKLMNEVTADADGIVDEVLVEDGTPVEYGQVLFRLKAQ